jgi:hypothetical protein
MAHDDDDNDLDTCHTFATDDEAWAFMLGFRMAGSDGICCEIDTQEPNTVLIDFRDAEADSRDEAHGHYLATITEWNREVAAIPASERRIAIEWSVNDVQTIREDLTYDQAWEVLLLAKRDHDATQGVTNDILWAIAARLFPLPE